MAAINRLSAVVIDAVRAAPHALISILCLPFNLPLLRAGH